MNGIYTCMDLSYKIMSFISLCKRADGTGDTVRSTQELTTGVHCLQY